MLGKLISSAVKVVTLPIDVAEGAMDVLCGGDGSKQSRRENPANIGSSIRDGVCKAIEDIDK